MIDLLAHYWPHLLTGIVLALAIIAYRALRCMAADVGGPGERIVAEQRWRHGGRR